VVDGQHGGRHEPGQAEDGADDDQEGHHEQIQVVAAAFLLKQNNCIGSFINCIIFS
jgi:hypothetical protein